MQPAPALALSPIMMNESLAMPGTSALRRGAGGAAELTATILSLGTNRLVRRGAAWLRARGLTRYVLPALLANEAFGAWRAWLALDAAGWW